MAELADAHGSGYTTSVNLQNSGLSCKITYNFIFAPVAELADAYGSGPYFRKEVQVQFLSGAPSEDDPNLSPAGEWFGFILTLALF